jgi:hypothetical protein
VEWWKGLKGVGKERDEDGNMISAKDELIDEMVAALLGHFPERDSTGGHVGPLVWGQTDWDCLHSIGPTRISMPLLTLSFKRVRQLLYNAVNRGVEKEATDAPSNIRFISTRTLFKQQYSAQILKRRDELRESTSQRDSLIAYNQAVKELLEDLRVQHPEEYEALEQTVEDMKVAQHQGFENQSEEIQQA